MSAREELLQYADRYGYTEHVNALLDAHRAEVLREAADALEALANRTTERGAGVLWATDKLRRIADEAAVR